MREEHYGQEAVDYLAEPLLSGIYGGDPRELSVTAVLPRFVELAQKYGSLTRGVLASRAQAPKAQSPAPLFRTLKKADSARWWTRSSAAARSRARWKSVTHACAIASNLHGYYLDSACASMANG